MAARNRTMFVERTDDGDYSIRKYGAVRISGRCGTQAEAIEKAEEIEPSWAIEAERVRFTDAGSPDKWRHIKRGDE